MPHPVFVVRLLVLASLVGVAGLAAGCGGSAATGDVEKIKVALSQFDVTVSNTSGTTLNEVVVEIAPTGPASHFVARIGRMSNNETRSIAHSGFSDRDSVPFSLRTAKPHSVIVSGSAVDGTPVRVEVPFKL